MFCGCPERGEQNDISPHKTAERFLCAVGVYGDSFHSNSLRINLLRLAAHLCGGACLSCSAVAPKGASRTTFPRIKPQSGFYAPSVYMVTVFIVTPCVSAAGCGQPALRYKLKMRCGAGGVLPRPYAWIGGAVRGEYGLPRQPVGWLAMTGIFGMGVQGWRGKGSARPSPIDPPRL